MQTIQRLSTGLLVPDVWRWGKVGENHRLTLRLEHPDQERHSQECLRGVARFEVLTADLLKLLVRNDACWAGDVQHHVFHKAQVFCFLLLTLVSFVFMYTKSLQAATLNVHQHTCTDYALPIYLVNCLFINSRPYYPEQQYILPIHLSSYTQGDSWVMDTTVRHYFRGICDQKRWLSTCLILISYGAEGVLSFSWVQWHEPRVTC
jgi:hypothetical protein